MSKEKDSELRIADINQLTLFQEWYLDQIDGNDPQDVVEQLTEDTWMAFLTATVDKKLCKDHLHYNKKMG